MLIWSRSGICSLWGKKTYREAASRTLAAHPSRFDHAVEVRIILSTSKNTYTTSIMHTSRLIVLTLMFSCSLLLVCCTHLGNPALEDVNNFMTLKKGLDSKESIYAKFGQPADVIYSNVSASTSVWTYVRSDMHPNGWSYVPYVGLLAGGTNQETTKAFFSFDGAGHFVEVHTGKDSSYVNGLGGLGGMIAGRSRNQVQRVQDEMNRMGKPFDHKQAVRLGEVR